MLTTNTEQPSDLQAAAGPKLLAMAGLSLSMLMASLDTSIVNAALPVLSEGFQASFQSTQWIVISYLLAITTLIVSAGRLGDMVGRRKLLLTGIGIFTISSFACGVAPNLYILLAGRAVQGIGAAIMISLAMALAGEITAGNKTGSAMGLMGTMSAVGTTLGPTLGGLLIGIAGWRSIFLINVPIGLINFMFVRQYLCLDTKKAVDKVVPALDKPGTVVLTLTLAAYTLGMTMGGAGLGWLNLVLLVGAAAGAALFIMLEKRAAYPLIDLALFRDIHRSASLAMTTIVSAVLMATLVVGPFYLSLGLGLETSLASLVLSVGPLVAALGGVPAGPLVDHFGPGRMITAGLSGIAIGCGLLSVLPESLGISGYVGPVVVITGGYALFQAANNTRIMQNAGPDQRGVISGMLSLSRNLGLISGVSVIGAIFAAAVPHADLAAAGSPEIARGMRFTFAVAAGLIVVAIAIAVLAQRSSAPKLNAQGKNMAAANGIGGGIVPSGSN